MGGGVEIGDVIVVTNRDMEKRCDGGEGWRCGDGM